MLLIVILSYQSWVAFGARSEQLSITRQIEDGTDALLSSLKDAETGQRGFLLTGNDRYLEPYRKALAEMPVTLKTLADVARTSHPAEARQIDALKPLIQAKLDELQQTIDMRRSKGLDAALAVVQSDRGQAIMDQIRGRISEIQTLPMGT